ncbi:transmembrane protein, putative (macronuclear) [Tetrahymena thermophila SB210]|uniref:Transmembrane protein, putative n=1 Tax=Tetrahymena thermophila (strain SB210) TaxID=312017 RepID=Q23PS8_TETTS|nr:transmembrane protein, putative [Tetrahymena thermophila SB210]EAR98607.2 transmembrane protein, putative [Tetrahymena thermophila SB210]|eukprot:XP_001018852.2 transmembrane protein, putative [Tetrahymena thermophila SB210]
MFDQNLQIYQCQSCSMVSDVQNCKNGCSSSQYYSMQYGQCYEYCVDGKIAKTYSQCGSSQHLCIDGYHFSSQNKCEKNICSAQIPTSDTFSAFLFQCLNCSIAYYQKDCQNPCIPGSELQYYYSLQQLCMVYCGNGIIAIDKKTCPSSNICINGTQWSDLEKKCKKQLITCSTSSPDNYLLQCSNCSLVTNINYCQNSCLSQYYYDYKQQKCMFYCFQGVIAQDQASCQSSNFCIDGFINVGQGKCNPISKDENNNQDGQINSNNNQNTSKYEQNSLTVNIMISLFAALIILILAASFAVLKKLKVFLNKNDQMQQIINNYESTLKKYIDDKISNQQLEIDSLKIIRITNNQLKNNQIEIEINQNGEDQLLQDQNDSQRTIKQFANNEILQQQYSQQNYQENPLLQQQVSQQKDINQL